MRADDNSALLDVALAARRVLEFGEGLDRTSLSTDLKTQSSILHQLLVMGEAVKRLSAEFRTLHSEIDWRGAAGMRDKLIHQYDRVDLNEIWRAITIEIPQLSQNLEPLLPIPPDEKGT